jgi:hypothetical protein
VIIPSPGLMDRATSIPSQKQGNTLFWQPKRRNLKTKRTYEH